MAKPVRFFMVVFRRSLGTRLFGWLLPRRATVKMVNRRGKEKQVFHAKIGTAYTCETRDVALDMGRLAPIYRLVKFGSMAQVRSYCRAQGMSAAKFRELTGQK